MPGQIFGPKLDQVRHTCEQRKVGPPIFSSNPSSLSVHVCHVENDGWRPHVGHDRRRVENLRKQRHTGARTPDKLDDSILSGFLE